MTAGRLLLAAFALVVSAAAGLQAAAGAPEIGRPRAAPPTPANVAPLPPAKFDPTLEIGGEQHTAGKVETRLTLPVRVNGRGPFNFIVDSGADTSVIGQRIATALDLPLGNPVVLNGVTSRSIVDRVKVAELALGGSAFRNLELPALREADLGGDGLIGIDTLVHQRLMMDFEKRLIQLEDARRPVRTRPGDIVVTARRQRGQLILTQAAAAGLRLDAVIDTGTQVTIGNLALRDKLMRRNRDKFVTVSVTGVTGETIDMQMAIIGELQLGPVELRDVPIAFADVPPFKLFGLDQRPALLLGTDLLETFRRVSLDFRARKVRFQLRRCKPAGVIISTSPEKVTRISSRGTPDVCTR